MTGNEKWNALITYLRAKQKTILTELKRNAMGEVPYELRANGAQLALSEDILSYAERLDLDKDTLDGRPAPPKYDY